MLLKCPDKMSTKLTAWSDCVSDCSLEWVNETDIQSNIPRVVLKHLSRVCEEASAELRSFLGLSGILRGSIGSFWHVFCGGCSSINSRSRHDHANRMHMVQCQSLRPAAARQEISPPIDYSETWCTDSVARVSQPSDTNGELK